MTPRGATRSTLRSFKERTRLGTAPFLFQGFVVSPVIPLETVDSRKTPLFSPVASQRVVSDLATCSERRSRKRRANFLQADFGTARALLRLARYTAKWLAVRPQSVPKH